MSTRNEIFDELMEKLRDYRGFDAAEPGFIEGIDAAISRLEHAKWEEQ